MKYLTPIFAAAFMLSTPAFAESHKNTTTQHVQEKSASTSPKKTTNSAKTKALLNAQEQPITDALNDKSLNSVLSQNGANIQDESIVKCCVSQKKSMDLSFADEKDITKENTGKKSVVIEGERNSKKNDVVIENKKRIYIEKLSTGGFVQDKPKNDMKKDDMSEDRKSTKAPHEGKVHSEKNHTKSPAKDHNKSKVGKDKNAE